MEKNLKPRITYKQALAAAGENKAELARVLRVSRQRVYAIGKTRKFLSDEHAVLVAEKWPDAVKKVKA